MWIQTIDPFGNLWLSAFVAAIPILTFLVCLTAFKLKGIVAAGIAVLIEIVVAMWAFGMPAGSVAGAGLLGLLTAIWPIAYIIVMAVWLYRLAVAAGHFEVIRARGSRRCSPQTAPSPALSSGSRSPASRAPSRPPAGRLCRRRFPLFAPIIGWFGVFITGSVVNNNTLFAQLQVATAKGIGVDVELLIAANTAGGTTAKVISPQSIAIAAGAAGLSGRESEILRASIWYSLGMLAFICVWTYTLSLIL